MQLSRPPLIVVNMSGRLLRIVIALLIPCLPAWSQTSQSDLRSIGASLFIGQIYPSGNVYLRSFAGSELRPDAFPKSLLLVPLPSEDSALRTTPLTATLNAPMTSLHYIPSLERMDEGHVPCSPVRTDPTNPAFQYRSDDFFTAMFDYCDGNEGVVIYRSAATSFSVKVLAFTPELLLANPTRVSGLRPTTPTETEEVLRRKRQLETRGECTTTPAFIDAATRVLEASLGGNLTLRLSSYSSPGCAGHLATVYIADILRGGDLIRSFQVAQSQGPL